MEHASTSEQEFLKKITEIIDANLHNEQFGVKDLIREMGMSRSGFHRRITEAGRWFLNDCSFLAKNISIKHLPEL